MASCNATNRTTKTKRRDKVKVKVKVKDEDFSDSSVCFDVDSDNKPTVLDVYARMVSRVENLTKEARQLKQIARSEIGAEFTEMEATINKSGKEIASLKSDIRQVSQEMEVSQYIEDMIMRLQNYGDTLRCVAYYVDDVCPRGFTRTAAVGRLRADPNPPTFRYRIHSDITNKFKSPPSSPLMKTRNFASTSKSYNTGVNVRQSASDTSVSTQVDRGAGRSHSNPSLSLNAKAAPPLMHFHQTTEHQDENMWMQRYRYHGIDALTMDEDIVNMEVLDID